MKNLIKIFCILMLIILFTSATCYASEWGDISGAADDFIKHGEKGKLDTVEINKLIQGLGNILTTIGVVVVFGGLLVIGIKYMVATPEEAAKLKTKLVGLAVAGVVVIGAYGIWRLAFNIFSNIA